MMANEEGCGRSTGRVKGSISSGPLKGTRQYEPVVQRRIYVSSLDKMCEISEKLSARVRSGLRRQDFNS